MTRRFKFAFGENGERGTLEVSMSSWGGTKVGIVTAELEDFELPPRSANGRQCLRAAERASGLRLAFRAIPWRLDGKWVRPVVFHHDDEEHLVALLGGAVAN